VIARAHFGRVLFVEDNERLQRAMLFSIMRVFGLWGTLLAPTIVVADAPSTAIPNQTVTAPQITLAGNPVATAVPNQTVTAPQIILAGSLVATSVPNQTVTAPQIVLTGTASTLRPVLDRGKP
jgi:hypothetical protein